MKTVAIKGMSCQHCVQSVIQALESLDGVVDVQVSLEEALANYDTTKEVSEADIEAAITKIGFEVGD